MMKCTWAACSSCFLNIYDNTREQWAMILQHTYQPIIHILCLANSHSLSGLVKMSVGWSSVPILLNVKGAPSLEVYSKK